MDFWCKKRGFIQCKNLGSSYNVSPESWRFIWKLFHNKMFVCGQDLMVFTPLGRWINNMIAWHTVHGYRSSSNPLCKTPRCHQAHAVFEHIEFPRTCPKRFPACNNNGIANMTSHVELWHKWWEDVSGDDFELIIYFYIIVYRCVSKIYLDTL